MARIIVQEAALGDFERLYQFLAKHDQHKAKQAIGRINKAVLRLAEYPQLVPPLGGEYRIMSVPFGKRGYSIAHTYDEERNHILILGIKHQLEEFYSFELQDFEEEGE